MWLNTISERFKIIEYGKLSVCEGQPSAIFHVDQNLFIPLPYNVMHYKQKLDMVNRNRLCVVSFNICFIF